MFPIIGVSSPPCPPSLLIGQNARLQYIYTDGNNNTWRIWKSCVEYIPITPAQSGSGIYSGGVPVTVRLEPKQYAELRQLLQQAVNDVTLHKVNREKGDSAITEKQSDRTIYLARSSKWQKKIENWLKNLSKSN